MYFNRHLRVREILARFSPMPRLDVRTYVMNQPRRAQPRAVPTPEVATAEEVRRLIGTSEGHRQPKTSRSSIKCSAPFKKGSTAH
jgi:hypothetical protein